MGKEKKYIVTVRGDKQLRKDCRLIEGAYFLIDRDCVKFNDRWNRINNNRIVKKGDRWVSIGDVHHSNLIVIEILQNALVFGYTHDNSIYPEYSGYKYISEELIKVLNPLYTPIKPFYGTNYPYNIDYSNRLHAKININKAPVEELYDFSDILNYTWGVELETWNINIQNYFLIKNELYPVKDGSLKVDGELMGHEYVTGIIRTNSDMNKLKNSCDLIGRKYNDEVSSLHVHVGVDLDVEQTTTLYMLILKIQNQLNEFFPRHRRSLNYLRNKEKDYCKNIESLNLFRSNNPEADLMTHYFDELVDSDAFRVREHHLGNASKWNFSKRYTNVNFLNYILGGPTIEFRCHNMTTDIREIYAWMKIIRDIIDYSKVNKEVIRDRYRKILLEDVIVDRDVKKYYLSKVESNSAIARRRDIKLIELNEIN